jgi:hypothetical protein
MLMGCLLVASDLRLGLRRLILLLLKLRGEFLIRRAHLVNLLGQRLHLLLAALEFDLGVIELVHCRALFFRDDDEVTKLGHDLVVQLLIRHHLTSLLAHALLQRLRLLASGRLRHRRLLDLPLELADIVVRREEFVLLDVRRQQRRVECGGHLRELGRLDLVQALLAGRDLQLNGLHLCLHLIDLLLVRLLVSLHLEANLADREVALLGRLTQLVRQKGKVEFEGIRRSITRTLLERQHSNTYMLSAPAEPLIRPPSRSILSR